MAAKISYGSDVMDGVFDFQNLFVFDLANNHQGSVAHGKAVIRAVGQEARKHDVRGLMKFQFRQLDSFVHPAHRKDSDNKHIPRFLSTRLGRDEYQILLDEVRAQGMMAACTPFDEASVDMIVDMGFDVLKIASCSARDWPLLERAAEANMPVIFSTGGLETAHIDDLVSFFDHRGVDTAIMHCVAIYPTPEENCQLNQITALRKRYQGKTIGWSTHEDQDATAPIQIAYALGARMFERHVGLPTDEIKLNAYSSTPEQLNTWLSAHEQAIRLCGAAERPDVVDSEREAIEGLRRGVYAAKPIRKGQTIERAQVYFAMPYVEGQLPSGEWKEGIVAGEDVKTDGCINMSTVTLPDVPDYQMIKSALHDVKALLNEARVPLNSSFEVEYSHHYGMKDFREVGAVIINCINRSYCKKIIVQLAGQRHPAHFHKRKEETFQVLHGEVHVTMDGHERVLRAGETCLIQPGVWHSFWTDTGCIFEEVSTTHYNDDSFYKDKRINEMERAERKTVVDHWGRFQTEPADALPGIGAQADSK